MYLLSLIICILFVTGFSYIGLNGYEEPKNKVGSYIVYQKDERTRIEGTITKVPSMDGEPFVLEGRILTNVGTLRQHLTLKSNIKVKL